MKTIPARRFAWISLASAAVFFLSQTTTFLHTLRVAHRVCREHGEIIHVGSANAVASPSSQAGPRLRSAAGSTTGPTHTHDCIFANYLRLNFSGPPLSTGLQLKTESPPQPIPALAAVQAGPPRILIAPKQSPPAIS